MKINQNYIAPDIWSWQFASEISEFVLPVFPGSQERKSSFSLSVDFADPAEVLQTAWESVRRYFVAAGYQEVSGNANGAVAIQVKQKKSFGREEYQLEVKKGKVQLTAGDTEGVRRGIYALEDLLCQGDGELPPSYSVKKKTWLKNRLGRSPFSPVKRWPLNQDELLDQRDYYPDALLERYAHDGVNGIWIIAALRELCHTSYATDDPQRKERITRLNQLVKRCGRYGIRVFLKTIEPFALTKDDEVRKNYPEMFGPASAWEEKACFCPASEVTRRYLYDSMKDLFAAVPGLGGLVNICQGERATICLSSLWSHESKPVVCQGRCGLSHGEILSLAQKAMYDGMRASSATGDLIAWFYCPQTEKSAPWVLESSSRIPEGVIPQFNFESRGKKRQLGKIHYGGDYWVSYVGPSERFRQAAAGNPVKDLSAKLQLSSGHEFTIVPYVPAPGIVYRKYHGMHKLGVNSVMQSWTIGNFPGLLTNAMGLLCTEEFKGTEKDFLYALARTNWRNEDATTLVRAWQHFCNGYLCFPFTLLFQYYGPQNSFVNWKFFFLPELEPLSMPWKPNYPASGDAIGESLGDFTLEEVLTLLERLNSHWRKGEKLLQPLREKYADDQERIRDIQVAEAVGICFAGTENLVRFYLLRRKWFTGDKAALAEMIGLVEAQKELYQRLLPILESDSRIGFHGEALTRVFDENKVRDALAAADVSLAEGRKLQKSTGSPISAVRKKGVIRECKAGAWHETTAFRWKYAVKGENMEVQLQPAAGVNMRNLEFMWIDCCGTKFPLWELFNCSGDALEYNGNRFFSVTGKRYKSGLKHNFARGVYTFTWPLNRLPLVDGDPYVRFNALMTTDKGMVQANGAPLEANRLLLGFMTPEETVCLTLPKGK